MKVRPPPPLPPISAETLQALQEDPGAFTVEQDGKYLHWEELRHRPRRPALSHERWWGVIKMARRSLNRLLPLMDAAGTPFTFSMTDTIQRLVHEVDRDASGRIELPENITNQATRDRYVVSSLFEEAFRSSQLEGASTTRAVAKEMIRTQREPRTTSERMILNNFYAMEWVREHTTEPLSVALILELHAVVTRDALEIPDGAGRLRRDDEPVQVVDLSTGEVLHTPPPAASLPERVQRLCEFANANTSDGPFIHPVVRAILIHFWLAYDHPFVDGNGRTARALFYWSMLKQGYWVTEFLSISSIIKKIRSQYDKAFLYTESDENDTTYFVLHQLKVLRLAIDALHDYLKRKAEEVRDLESKLRVRDDLNHRQLALLSHALRHPDTKYTIEGHQTSHRVVYQTARTDLLGLVSAGYLEQSKVGKKLYFAPVKGFDRKLSARR